MTWKDKIRKVQYDAYLEQDRQFTKTKEFTNIGDSILRYKDTLPMGEEELEGHSKEIREIIEKLQRLFSDVLDEMNEAAKLTWSEYR